MKRIELNNLPSYTPWIETLLSENAAKRVKNQAQVIREYGVEKWGALLTRWLESPCGVRGVRGWESPPESIRACLVTEQLLEMSAQDAHNHYIELLEEALGRDPSRQLIEIGCGYGSVLLDLIKRGNIDYESIIGLEYTREGAELARCLAEWEKLDVTIGQGDFNSDGISDLELPSNSDILTSYSFGYVRDSARALKNIIKVQPRQVFHFEPIYQHYTQQTTLGLLQRRYMELNDYNSTLRLELERLSSVGLIEIIQETAQVFGSNCLLPASLIIWRPCISKEKVEHWL